MHYFIYNVLYHLRYDSCSRHDVNSPLIFRELSLTTCASTPIGLVLRIVPTEYRTDIIIII